MTQQEESNILNTLERITKPKRQVTLLKDVPDAKSLKKIELRKLKEEIKQETDYFKLSKLTIELVDKSGNDPIEDQLQDGKADPRKGSPLKNENPQSSIIQQIEPMYPLQKKQKN